MERNSVLKLFGVELDPFPLHEKDESASLSLPPSTAGKPSPPPPPEAKKFKCSNCFKIFTNPQALGGHQNAHKKEKMRRQKLQLQARKACYITYYIKPFFNNFCDGESENFVNFYAPSLSSLNKEVQISFGSNDYEYEVKCNNYVCLQENNRHKFSVRSSPSSHESKRICIRKDLDLHLGLGL